MRVFLLCLAITCASLQARAAAPAAGRELGESSVRLAGALRASDTASVEQILALPYSASLSPLTTLESLSGTHTLYQLEIEGRRVIGAGAALSLPPGGDGIVEARLPLFEESISPLAGGDPDPLSAIPGAGLRTLWIVSSERVWYPGEQGLVDADSWTVSDGTFTWDVVTRRVDGSTLEVNPLFYNAGAARIFPSNPVQRLADPDLRDQSDSAAAVPPAAYSTVTLEGLAADGALTGEHVSIINISSPDEGIPLPTDDLSTIDRADSRFEAANAYFHLDSSQRYLQSLGYRGKRRIINRSIAVDPRALGGADNSFYIARAGGGYLAFGVGGTDDAEDSDIILHEYGHAMQDAIAPGSFGGPAASEARALGEGFSDYWAFSAGWLDSIASGSDPFCLAEWDARCAGSAGCTYPPEAQCLRRVDSARSMLEFRRMNGTGVEHLNGEIWSSALSRIFLHLVRQHGDLEGRRIADILAIEGHFGVPPSPTFATVARRMIQADSVIFRSANRSTLCAAFAESMILEPGACSGRAPSVFYPSQETVMIPDADPSGVRLTRVVDDGREIEQVFVTIDIEHPQRGDLKLFLIAPDGTPVKLHDASFADTSSGIRVTYGLDAEPAESLGVLAGRSAAGVWTLHVVDTRSRDAGVVRSWGLGFTFRHDDPGKRSGVRVAILPVVVSSVGATGEWFSSDVILTAGDTGAVAELWFSRSSAAASEQRMDVSLEPRQTLRLRDPLRLLLGQGGSGTLDVRARSGQLRATSAIGSTGPLGHVSQAIPGVEPDGFAHSRSAPVLIPLHPQNENDRLNVGISEVRGKTTTARLRYWSAGASAAEDLVQLGPWQVVQFPLPHAADLLEISVSEGDGAVTGYVSIVRADSGDPAITRAATPRAGDLLVPVISAPGANGSSWTSDLMVANGSESVAAIELILRDGAGSARGIRQLAVPARSSIWIGDVVQTQFESPGMIGTLMIRSIDPLVIAASIRGTYSGGIVRQFIEPSPTDTPVSEQLLLPSSGGTSRRSNVFIASSEATPVSMNLTVRGSSGQVLATIDSTVMPHGLLVVPLPGAEDSGRVELKASPAARLASWISVVDNRSGDADTWSALPALE